ncbi:hypothetical protein EG834_16605, partial [bacterium]|nr:hypothetical protein [bacterium]
AFKRSPHKRMIVAIALSFALLLCWTAVRYTFFKDLYHTVPFLNQFRWPGRALSVGAMFIILLGGFGLEELLARIDTIRLNIFFKGAKQTSDLTISGRIFLLVLVLFGLGWAVRDIYRSNSVYLFLETKSDLYAESGFNWLKNLKQEEYTFGIFANSAISSENGTAGYLNQLRLRSIQDGWNAAPAPLNLGRSESINIEPQYWLLWEDEPLDKPGAVVVKEIGPLRIWKITIFPYAFTVPIGRFDVEPFVVNPYEVQPVISYTRDLPNGIAIETNTSLDSVLIVSESWSSGWRVTVDGQRADLGAVCNLLAIPLPPGKHTVEFKYAPVSFGLGVALSILAFLAVAVILLGGLVRKQKIGTSPTRVSVS